MKNNLVYGGRPIGRTGKVLLVLWSLCLLGGFVVARFAEPDSRGFGTHEYFGLPPCTIRAMFGIACPSCGMTTSFAHFVRGQFTQSAQANVAGLLLAVVCVVQIPWSFASVWQGRLWAISKPEISLIWLLLVLCGTAVMQWGVRLLLA